MQCVSLQFLKLALIFSTNSISVRFWEVDFTWKMFLYNCIFQDKTDEDKSSEDTPEAVSETTEEKAPGNFARTKVKEACDNIHIPKMPNKEKNAW